MCIIYADEQSIHKWLIGAWILIGFVIRVIKKVN